MFKLKRIAPVAIGLAAINAFAVDVNIAVKSAEGEILPGAVVVLKSTSQAVSPSQEVTAVMDQVDRQFKPRILAVPQGTPVSFPNSDSIKHHVYSFSPAKVFEIQLYKGSDNEPVIFNKAGVVELGCNVHDWMLGYIYVAESPYFAQLDANNEATLDVPNGEYQAWLWHPRMKDSDLANRTTVKVTDATSVTLTLTSSLQPDPFAEDELELDDFDIYE